MRKAQEPFAVAKQMLRFRLYALSNPVESAVLSARAQAAWNRWRRH